tara:strand:- start:1871 stop:2041 length:171 start_codon:yes stop_codon:yes gene_type:complete
MKITYESHGITVSVERDDDMDVYELGEALYNLCLSQSWSPVLLKSIFKKAVTDGEN